MPRESLRWSALAIQFDRVVSGVNASSFVLKRSGVAVAATVINNGTSKQFSLLPAAALAAGTTYTLTASAAITSVEGGALTPVSWSFTVAGTAACLPAGPPPTARRPSSSSRRAPTPPTSSAAPAP